MIKLKSLKKTKFSIGLKSDRILFLLITGLTIFGVLMVYNASVVEAFKNFGDKYYYLKNQVIWLLIGYFLMFIVAKVDLKYFKKMAPLLFVLNLIFLAIVLIPGFSTPIKGARRWLNFGFINFQPSEFIKLTFTLYLATWLNHKREFLKFLILIGLVGFLIVLEPDLGTLVVIVASAFFIYYLSGAPLWKFFSLGLIIIASGILIIISSPYRKSRLLTYLNPERDPLGASYHVRQVLIALGSGGIFGLGIGQSRQKYAYLPEVTSDSIFAVIAEEVGFAGSAVVILVYLAIVIRGFIICKNSKNEFSKLLAGGITSWFGLQIVINLSAMVVLVPLTGLPLPFVSYGGSSLVASLLGVGLLLNIAKSTNKNK